MWSMKTLFLLPVVMICVIVEAMRLLKHKIEKKAEETA
jgi:hypothetical protein